MKYWLALIIQLMIVQKSFTQDGWLQSNYGVGNLVSINFINNSTGYIFKSDKYLLKTTNKGLNWVQTPITLGNVFIGKGMFYNEQVGVFFINASSGYSLAVYTTTDGGNNWVQSVPMTQGNLLLHKAIMLNSTTGYCCGTDVDLFGLDLPVTGMVYKTTNSGMNWFTSFSGEFDIEDVYFPNLNTGFVCRYTIFKTTNSGSNWIYFSDGPRHRLAFSKLFSDTLYMSSAGGFVAKSINGGVNWTDYQTGVSDSLYDIFFLDNQTGFSIGSAGHIIKTTNGGINWNIQSSNTSKRLNEIWFLNYDTGFVAGDSGLLLTTYTGGITSLANNEVSLPEKYYLYQNYPNPFNPSTLIKFDLVNKEGVTLKIYDINGKLIEILVEQILSPGSYEYSFNSGELSSGIYFYEIIAGEFSEAKRMVLMK